MLEMVTLTRWCFFQRQWLQWPQDAIFINRVHMVGRHACLFRRARRKARPAGKGRAHLLQVQGVRILPTTVSECKVLIILVGAGRFERPTPCAQGMIVPQYRELLAYT